MKFIHFLRFTVYYGLSLIAPEFSQFNISPREHTTVPVFTNEKNAINICLSPSCHFPCQRETSASLPSNTETKRQKNQTSSFPLTIARTPPSPRPTKTSAIPQKLHQKPNQSDVKHASTAELHSLITVPFETAASGSKRGWTIPPPHDDKAWTWKKKRRKERKKNPASVLINSTLVCRFERCSVSVQLSRRVNSGFIERGVDSPARLYYRNYSINENSFYQLISFQTEVVNSNSS